MHACAYVCVCIHVYVCVYTCVNKVCMLVCECCLDNHFGYNLHAFVRTRTCMCVQTCVLDTILNKMYFSPCF